MGLGRSVGFGGCSLGGSQVALGIAGPPDVDRATGEAPLEIAVELSFSARLANANPRKT